jgi:hypothetical protein
MSQENEENERLTPEDLANDDDISVQNQPSSQANNTQPQSTEEIVYEKLVKITKEEGEILDRLIDYKASEKRTFEERMKQYNIQYSSEPPI